MAVAAAAAAFPSHSRTDWQLLTGQPGSGKTTAVKALAAELLATTAAHGGSGCGGSESRNGPRLRGFVTEEVLIGSHRIGFDVVTVPDGRRGVLSRKSGLAAGLPRTGQYSVDVAAFERLALPALADDDDPSVVYVLDEIGRMELHSAR